VDELKNLSVYEIHTKQLLFSEMNVTSVAWNS
jgi:intraflagellar transport protein 122